MQLYRIPPAFIWLSVLYLASGTSSKEIVVDDADTQIVYNEEGTLSSRWETTIPSIKPEPIDATQVHAGITYCSPPKGLTGRLNLS